MTLFKYLSSIILSCNKIPKDIVFKFEHNLSNFQQHETVDFVENVKPHLEHIINTFRIEDYPVNHQQNLSYTQTTKEQLLTMLEKFYKEVDTSGFMLEKFKELTSNNKYNFEIRDDISCSKAGKNPNGKFDILIKYSSLERMFIDSAHELAHMMCQRNQDPKTTTSILSNKDKDINGLCGEIESIFMEKVAEKYLQHNGYLTKLNQNERIVNNLIIPSHKILQLQDILKSTTPPITPAKINNFFADCNKNNNPNTNLYENRIKEVSSNPDERNLFQLRYIIGELVSEKLMEIYTQNPNITMPNFIYYLQNNDGINIKDATTMLFCTHTPFHQLINDYTNSLSLQP